MSIHFSGIKYLHIFVQPSPIFIFRTFPSSQSKQQRQQQQKKNMVRCHRVGGYVLTMCYTGPRTSFIPGKRIGKLFSFHTTLEKLLEWYNPLIVFLDPELPWLLLLHFKRCIHILNRRKAFVIWPSYWASSILSSLCSSSTFYLIYWFLMFFLPANVVFPAVHGN